MGSHGEHDSRVELSLRLTEDMVQAMRDQEKLRLSVLRMVRSAVRNAEIDLRRSLTEDEILAVLHKEVKQRKDTLQTIENAGRPEAVSELLAELAILYSYLPEELSDEALRVLVAEAVAQVGATSRKDMGKVMQAAMEKARGRADGKTVSRVVQELLSAP